MNSGFSSPFYESGGGKATAHVLLRDGFAFYLHEARPQQLVMTFKHTTERAEALTVTHVSEAFPHCCS